jgi:hypothetical protein
VVLGILIGGVIGGVGTLIALTPKTCACEAILVLQLSVRSTGEFRSASAVSYLFAVTNVSNGQPTYGNLAFYFFNGTGQGVVPDSGWTFELSNAGHAISRGFDSNNPSALTGVSNVSLGPGQTWNVTVPDAVLGGGSLLLYGEGNFSGTVSVGIP